MDLCSLEDAFPNIDTKSVHKSSGFPYVGGTDSKPSREERRAARRLAKKLKGPAATYSDSITPDLPPTDPDRPAMKRMEAVESVQEEKEGFKIPVLPKASCLFSDTGTPAYFGKGEDDTEEGFSSFSAVPGDDPNYVLQPDFVKSFDLKGAAKAGGEIPELNDSWKPMTPAASYTAYQQGSGEEPTWSMNTPQKRGQVAPKSTIYEDMPARVDEDSSDAKDESREALLERVNELVKRLETLEKKRSQDTQTEILMFVGTGFFILLSLELLTRR
jgi:hypothetical protein